MKDFRTNLKEQPVATVVMWSLVAVGTTLRWVFRLLFNPFGAKRIKRK